MNKAIFSTKTVISHTNILLKVDTLTYQRKTFLRKAPYNAISPLSALLTKGIVSCISDGLEAEVTLAVFDLVEIVDSSLAAFGIRNIFKFTADHSFTEFLCFGRSVVFEVFLQCHEGVRVTAVLDLSYLAKSHEAVACTSLSVAGCAE